MLAAAAALAGEAPAVASDDLSIPPSMRRTASKAVDEPGEQTEQPEVNTGDESLHDATAAEWMIERLMRMRDDQRLKVLCAVIKTTMKSKSLDAQYSWAEAINEAACLNAGPAPKPANGASDEPPKAVRPLKRRGNRSDSARDGGRFFIIGGNRTEGVKAEYAPAGMGQPSNQQRRGRCAGLS